MNFKIMLAALAWFAMFCATIAYCVHDGYAHPAPLPLSDVERCAVACFNTGRAMESWARVPGDGPFACTCAKDGPEPTKR